MTLALTAQEQFTEKTERMKWKTASEMCTLQVVVGSIPTVYDFSPHLSICAAHLSLVSWDLNLIQITECGIVMIAWIELVAVT